MTEEIEDFYPSPTDPDFQAKIYQKREFIINKFPEREKLTNYEDVEEYRTKICTGKRSLREQQLFLSKFINPNTPYKGLIVMHGTGTGKCLMKSHKVTLYSENGLLTLSLEKIHENYASNVSIFDGIGCWYYPNRLLFVDSMENNSLVKRKIKHIYRQKVNELLNKVFLATNDGSEKSITITQIHKLYTDIGWTANIKLAKYIAIPRYSTVTKREIENIKISDTLSEDFVWAKIQKVEEIQVNDYVYDLEIEETHNFISEDILVSNTCAGISIAEKFKPLVDQYHTKIYVLVGGPLIKENWKSELVKCAGASYVPELSKTKLTSSTYRNFKNKVLSAASQYYRFISYPTFYKKVLGEKIPDKSQQTGKKTVYKKTKEGKFKRDIGIDRIKSINNSLIIVDEAHHMVNNFYGEALKKIIESSKNLKIVLLTATPMRNLADNFIELLNFVRPLDAPIKRDNVFTSQTGHQLEFKKGGPEYLRKMATGYISFLKGADPITFAKRVDVGVIPKSLMYTKVIRCFMLDFQRDAYLKLEEQKTDSLDKHSEAVANFVFPSIDSRENISGVFGKEGLVLVKDKIMSNGEKLNLAIGKYFDSSSKRKDVSYIDKSDNNTDTVTGEILTNNLLKHFSIKFFVMLNEINSLVWSKKGVGLAFIYSNLVKTGIELIKEILFVDGYLEYQENNSDYKISDNTKCYYCGNNYSKHKKKESLVNIESYEYKKYTEGIEHNYTINKSEPPSHQFYPAVFIAVTGKASDIDAATIQEEKIRILRDIFSHPKNKDGKHIKLVLGSQVMTEAVSLSNVREVHIVDANFHLGKVDQIIGRAIRYCYHYNLMSKENPYPEVRIYKYVISLKNNKLSSEEILYKKAEKKYHLIKQVERILQEIAVDCPLNRNVNVFAEEIEQYKGCKELDKTKTEQPNLCPASCNFTTCEMKCSGDKLNKLFWDEKRKIYIDIDKKDIDYSTFTKDLVSGEVTFAKDKIKELYKLRSFYSLVELVEYVKKSYDKSKLHLYDDYFTLSAIDYFVLKDENDFNKYMGGLYDKFGRQGYLIQVSEYYIFQSYEYPEKVSMYYRENFDSRFQLNSSVNNFIKTNPKLNALEDTALINEKKKIVKQVYDFDSVFEYYENRNEYAYVGIIDSMVQKSKNAKITDVFKIREQKNKKISKKRAPGVPTLKGSVCATSKTKEYLKKVVKTLQIKSTTTNRMTLCDLIKQKLMFMEKYSNNNVTYLIIPFNHSEYKFPYNLKDRVKFIIKKITEEINGIKYEIKTINFTEKDFGTKVSKYEIVFYGKIKDDTDELFKSYGGKKEGGKWIIIVD